MKCQNCGIELENKRAGTKYCSQKCKKEAFLKRSIGTDKRSAGTDKVKFAERIIPEVFEFTVKHTPLNPEYDDKALREAKAKPRTAKYWYDVPLGAVPVIKKDWPEMPDYMNGRDYFLWWKNEFDTKDGDPIILNPFPEYDNVQYVQAGEGSRRWGS